MLCLKCEEKMGFRATSCDNCGFTFEIVPPNLSANHISQLSYTIRKILTGNDSVLEDLQDMVLTINYLISSFTQKWSLDKREIHDGLSVELKEKFYQPIKYLDAGIKQLKTGVELVELYLKTLQLKELEDGLINIEKGFTVFCQSLAWVMKLEEELYFELPEVGVISDLKA